MWALRKCRRQSRLMHGQFQANLFMGKTNPFLCIYISKNTLNLLLFALWHVLHGQTLNSIQPSKTHDWTAEFTWKSVQNQKCLLKREASSKVLLTQNLSKNNQDTFESEKGNIIITSGKSRMSQTRQAYPSCQYHQKGNFCLSGSAFTKLPWIFLWYKKSSF